MIKTKINLLLLLLLLSSSKVYAASGLTIKPSAPASDAYGSIQLDRLSGALLFIKNGQFKKAYETLTLLSQLSENEADRQNLLGFAARKLGNFSIAKKHYKKALEINPLHLPALQYQGELFLALGDVKNAKLNLRRLKERCFLKCPVEYKELKAAIKMFE